MAEPPKKKQKITSADLSSDVDTVINKKLNPEYPSFIHRNDEGYINCFNEENVWYKWRRPKVDWKAIHENKTFSFQQVATDYIVQPSNEFPESGLADVHEYIPIIRTFGVTEAGNSVCLYSSGFLPYIYVEADKRRINVRDTKILHDYLEKLMNDTHNYSNLYESNNIRLSTLKSKGLHPYMNTDSAAEILCSTKNVKVVHNKRCIHNIEVVYKCTSRNYHKYYQPYYKITLTLPQYVPPLRSLINDSNLKVWTPLQNKVVTEEDLLYDSRPATPPNEDEIALLELALLMDIDSEVNIQKQVPQTLSSIEIKANDSKDEFIMNNPNIPFEGIKQTRRYKKHMSDLNANGCCYLDRLTYEDNVVFEMRFMIDVDLTGSGWIEIDHHNSKYVSLDSANGIAKDNKLIPLSSGIKNISQYPAMSRTQIEIRAYYNSPVTMYHSNSEPEWDKQAPLRILSFDIECETRISFPDPLYDAVIQIASVLKLSDSKSNEVKHKIIFTKRSCLPIDGMEVYSFNDEQDLLKAQAMLFREIDPDIITGHNTDGFDFTYLFARSRKLKSHELSDISRCEFAKCYTQEARMSSRAWGNNKTFEVNTVGRVAFDELKWVRRNLKLRSYTLNSVASEIVGETKEDVPHTMIPILYKGTDADRKRLAVYCGKDALLPIRVLDAKMAIPKELEITRLTGIQWKQVLGNGQSIKTLRHSMGFMFKQNYIIPNENGLRAALSSNDPKTRRQNIKDQRKIDKYGVDEDDKDEDDEDGKKKESKEGYVGAIVLPPKTGYYYKEFVITLDFASLYPSIMMAHNLCFTTFIPKDQARKIYLKDERSRMFIIFADLIQIRCSLSDVNSKHSKYWQCDSSILNINIKTLETIITGAKFNNTINLDVSDLELNEERNALISNIKQQDKILKIIRDYLNSPQLSSQYSNDTKISILAITTQIDALRKRIDVMYDYIVTPDVGHHFVRPHIRKGILPQILFFILDARGKAKKEMEAAVDKAKKLVYDLRQLALKLSANSVYGFTGAKYSAGYTKAVAESVTAYGRTMIYKVKDEVESTFTKKNNYDWDAEVIAGDTDSVMIKADIYVFSKQALRRPDNPVRLAICEVEKLDPNIVDCLDKYEGMTGALKFGKKAASIATKLFEDSPPISMAFEKIYWPYLLMSKKRYAGMWWTKPDKPDKMDSKGLELVRRESILFTVITQKRCLEYFLKEKDEPKALDYTRNRIELLRTGKISEYELIITKQLNQEAADYKNKQPHAELNERMKKRNGGKSEYNIGDRIAFVLKAGDSKSPQYELAEDPVYAVLNNVPIDYGAYINRQFIKPLARIFKATFGTIQNATSALLTGKHMNHIIKPPPSKEKGKIGSFFIAMGATAIQKCYICKKEGSLFCKACMNGKKENIQSVIIHKKNESELAAQKYRTIKETCWKCQATEVETEILCTARECNVFYDRIRLKNEDEKINNEYKKMTESIPIGSLDW